MHASLQAQSGAGSRRRYHLPGAREVRDLQAAAQKQLAGEVAELKAELEVVLGKKLREEVRA